MVEQTATIGSRVISREKSTIGYTVVPEDKRGLAAVCYIFTWLGGIVLLFLAENNRAMKFHAFQDIVLGAAFTLFYLVLNMVIWPIMWNSSLWSLAGIISLIELVGWLYFVYGAYQVYSKGDFQSPVADFVKANFMK
ncbi:MAG TPA: hypothetical protein VGJ92_04650 [Methanocella sp.]|jgi:uncharacterized membrane protein